MEGGCWGGGREIIQSWRDRELHASSFIFPLDSELWEAFDWEVRQDQYEESR